MARSQIPIKSIRLGAVEVKSLAALVRHYRASSESHAIRLAIRDACKLHNIGVDAGGYEITPLMHTKGYKLGKRIKPIRVSKLVPEAVQTLDGLGVDFDKATTTTRTTRTRRAS